MLSTLRTNPSLDSLEELGHAMANTPQDPYHHGEGDVATHTLMVLRALLNNSDWQNLPTQEQDILLLTALLHDSGKPTTTRLENNRWTSSGHSRKGAQIAQAFLYRHGFSKHIIDTVYGLILNHQVPFWLIEKDDWLKKTTSMSFDCPLHLLFIHATADATGRICNDKHKILEATELAKTLAQDAQCLFQERPFPTPNSRVDYFNKDDRYIEYQSQDPTGSNVLVMAGLPGAGKDTYLKDYPHPVISLDALRETHNVKWKDNQGALIQHAKEQARIYLRAKQPFAWNATNLTQRIRAPLFALLKDYDATITTTWIHTPYKTLIDRNNGRGIPIEKLINIQEPITKRDTHHITIL